ncbi:MAG: TonB-dependent receptor [Caulobacterales bacterium]|nr:TonB-dependent receptor [Caulobacterales bacterium]
MKREPRYTALRSSLLCGTALTMLASPTLVGLGAASAQSASQAPETIVVTARKREETAQEVPISLSAYSDTALNNSGVDDLTSLFELTPGLENNKSGDRNTSLPAIRGVGSQEFATIRAKVTSFIDGVPVLGQQGTLPFVGLERVEIFRGPQSAAFGRSTFGGAINYVTRSPSDTPEFSLRGQYGDQNTFSVSGLASVPIVGDQLGVTLVGLVDGYDGDDDWVNVDGAQLGGTQSQFYYGKVRWAPSDRLEANLTFLHGETEDDVAPVFLAPLSELQAHPLSPVPCAVTDGAVNPGMNPSCVIIGEVQFADPVTFNFDYDNPGNPVLNPHSSNDKSRIQGQLSYELDNGVAVTALAMYGEEQYERWTDRDGGVATLGMTIHPSDPTDMTERYGELRVASSADSPLQWMVGASIYDYDFFTTVFGNLTGGVVMDRFSEDARNIGGFFSLGYDVTDRMTASFEGRYQNDDVGGFVPAEASSTGAELESREETSSFQPRLALTYGLTDAINVYGQVARGNNPAGFNSQFIDPGSGPGVAADAAGFDLSPFVSFEEEEVWSYEAGSKGSALDGQLVYAAAVYYLDWQGYVGPVDLSIGDTFSRTFVNLGDLSGFGAEVEGAYRPTDNLDFRGTFAYVGTEYDDNACSPVPTDYGVPADQIEPFACASIAGSTPALISKYSTSFAATFSYPIWDDAQWFVRADHRWRSKRYLTDMNLGYLPSFHLVDLRTGVATETWRVELYGENIFDEDSPTGSVRFFDGRLPGMSFNNAHAVARRPAAFGVRLSYDY